MAKKTKKGGELKIIVGPANTSLRDLSLSHTGVGGSLAPAPQKAWQGVL
jgi:hypothetical protein